MRCTRCSSRPWTNWKNGGILRNRYATRQAHLRQLFQTASHIQFAAISLTCAGRWRERGGNPSRHTAAQNTTKKKPMYNITSKIAKKLLYHFMTQSNEKRRNQTKQTTQCNDIEKNETNERNKVAIQSARNRYNAKNNEKKNKTKTM